MADPKSLRNLIGWLRRRAGNRPEPSPIRNEAANRLLDRLEGLKFAPHTIVNLGSGPGEATGALAGRYGDAHVLVLEEMPDSVVGGRPRQGRALVADAARMPLAESSVDLLFSNLALQRFGELPDVLNGFRRVLRPGGLLLVSVFGPDTLSELRQDAQEAGQALALRARLDVQTVGDALIRAGFTEPVLDTDWITQTFTEPAALVDAGAAAGVLQSNADHAPLRARLEQLHGDRDEFPTTWEIVYASAWAPDEGAPIRTGGGEEASVSIAGIGRRKRP
ncbi:MAG: methyltransferase domain-containing protein [Wenzhouxiangellaceae bacterium]|nr:methyltransferase domain-containing protein [Wenzhouxiangellaceae bacterium]